MENEEEKNGVDDMIKLKKLDDEAILKNLRIRYAKDLIYVG